MRTSLSVLILVLAPTTASADVWQSLEGSCEEWQGHWEVEQGPDGVWVGSVEHLHVGGPCEPRNNTRLRSDVRAVIVGDSFFAARKILENGNVCQIYARVAGDRVNGIELCEGLENRVSFTMQMLPGGNLEPRHRNGEQGDWPDDQQALEPEPR
jgi:hypothetical protein